MPSDLHATRAQLPRRSAHGLSALRPRTPARSLAGRAHWLAALLVALAVFAWMASRLWFTCDDAFITFRYARNLARGLGPYFDATESGRIEGYSNFLWMLWISVAERLGLEAPAWANVTSIVCGAGLFVMVARVLARRSGGKFVVVLAGCAFLALQPALAAWSTSGLETMPFVLATFLAWERLAEADGRPRPVQAGIAALAAALLRADGALWAGLALALGTIAFDSASVRDRLRLLRAPLAILAAGVVLHLALRHAWYGELAPNTAHAKWGFSIQRFERGIAYDVAMLFALPAMCLAAPCAFAFAVACEGRRGAVTVLAPLAILCATLAYVLIPGGDFMPFARFLVVVAPFAALAVGDLAARVGVAPRALAWVLVAASPWAAFDVALVPASWRERVHFRWNDEHAISEWAMWRGMKDRAEQWAWTGRALALYARPDESIILGNIGAVGYYTGLRVHDLFGLVSPSVLHATQVPARASAGHEYRVDASFFFDERPTYLSAYLARTDTPPDLGLPEDWARWLVEGRVVLERHPLPADLGLSNAIELRVLRFRWAP